MILWPHTALLTFFGIATGIALLLAFKRFSNRPALALAKRQVWAQLYALRLYSDEPAVLWQVQKKLLLWNGRYLLQMLRPAAIVFLPLSGLLFFLDGFYGHRPLKLGESTLVSVHSSNLTPSLAGEGVSIETPALRIPTSHTIYWRIRVDHTSADLVFAADRQPVHTGRGLTYISACPRCSGQAINVQYPPVGIDIFGYHIPWLAWFLIVCAVTMFILRRRFDVIF